ncbi:AlpA family transcriptional regulator [Pseudomonas gingeri]|uniref:helix-turn-helix transcriptional regulator n=1 Tax=Pseudomonas gingeri TaxID=117681 RepID=UPI0015A4B2C2|nr:AlpA family transcriptional regulator [Pseudomonas gingeri]NWA24080.1 AlpA family transcriptional regulator [Pseudomonas gingeri]
MNTPQENPSIEFIRLPEVKRLVGLKTTTIYKMANEGTFPKQIKLGARSVAWIKSEVLAWSQQKVDDARASESPLGSVRTIGKKTRE